MILGGAGAGGVVVTDDDASAERVRVLRNYGHAPGLSLDPMNLLGGEGFVVLEEGHNERLDEVQAAVLRAKLPTLDARIAQCRQAAARYDGLLDGSIVETPVVLDDAKAVYFAYNVMLDDRDEARRFLASRGDRHPCVLQPPAPFAAGLCPPGCRPRLVPQRRESCEAHGRSARISSDHRRPGERGGCGNQRV